MLKILEIFKKKYESNKIYKDNINIGYYTAKGVHGYLNHLGVAILVLFVIFHVVYNVFPILMDDSDLSPSVRSGLTVYTDYKYGTQYVRAGHAMYPRLNRDGQIVVIDKL